MRVFTHNSIYEVDTERKLIRRVEGKGLPNHRFAPDGDWKPYHEVVGLEVGPSFPCVTWPDGGVTWLSSVAGTSERMVEA